MLSSGLASASHTGDHSEPGEAKMRSTPMPDRTRRNASAPVSPLTSIMFDSSVRQVHRRGPELGSGDETTWRLSCRLPKLVHR